MRGFFSILRLDDGIVKIAGNRPPSSYIPQLNRMGLRPNGIFRVWTSAEAVDDNAVEGEGKRVYAWSRYGATITILKGRVVEGVESGRLTPGVDGSMGRNHLGNHS